MEVQWIEDKLTVRQVLNGKPSNVDKDNKLTVKTNHKSKQRIIITHLF